MRLKAVRIKNFKLCRDVTVEINDSLTVLLGRNGAGKTTLLTAILFLKDIHAEMSPIRSRRYNARDYDVSTVTAEIEDEGELHVLEAKVFFDKNSIPTQPRHFSYSLSVGGQKPVAYDEYEYFFFSNRIFDEVERHNDENTTNVFRKMIQVAEYLNDVVSVKTTDFLHGDENDSILDVSPRAHVGHSRKANRKFLLDLYDLKTASPRGFERYRGVVSRTGSGLIDDIDFESITVPKSSVKAYRNGTLSTVEESRDLVVPIFSIDGNKLYSNQLSEGTFRILALIFYIMNSDSKILVIEEPELSIHVNLLSDVIELVKDAATQRHVILSTHSEKIVNMLDLEDITLVSRGSSGIEAKSVNSKLSSKNLESLKKYLVDGGTLGEYLLGE